MDDFSNHPKSVTELKLERDPAATWAPRDALIDMLRDIDSGRLKVSNLVISYEDENGSGYSVAGPMTNGQTLGLLEWTKLRIFENRDK